MDRELIEGSARRAGIELDAGMRASLDAFIHQLKEANRRFNLTAITEDEAIAILHLEDSWHLSAYIPQGARLIDVGTGAGFPGLALRLVRPDLDVTLVDSTLKKIYFLQDQITRLELQGARALHGRAEELAREAGHRDRYDVAVARAVSALPELVELCLPLVRKGGIFIAMKGEEDERDQASRAVHLLKGRMEDLAVYSLPGLDHSRSLVMVRKKDRTPDRYPRRMALIRKSPL